MVVEIISRFNGYRSFTSLKQQHAIIGNDLKILMMKYPSGINLIGYSQGKIY